jgi:radical SAM enzyme (TIGR01210 family)
LSLPYPTKAAERSQWITNLRPAREVLDPQKPYAFFLEQEYSSSGEVVPVATILLTNRECPWRCVMCDLWRNTLTESVPAGAIPAQIEYALSRLPPARQIKLYNSGSFFDPRAIPPGDYQQIAAQLASFDRVIVECHPALVGRPCFEFGGIISGQLEVAMGLETVHPEVLARLNKGMTLSDYSNAARLLRSNGIDLRAFILVQPPFMRPVEALHWAKRSLDFAFDCDVTAATLIATRRGNGAMEALEAVGDFAPPDVNLLEAALIYGIKLNRGRVFADLWGLTKSSSSAQTDQITRLQEINLTQTVSEFQGSGIEGTHS